MSIFSQTLYALSNIDPARDAATIQRMWREAKVMTGCQGQFCQGYPEHHSALDAAHIDADTKYRTRDGHTVEPADMVKSDGRGRTRYGFVTILDEAEKVRILCKNCHALETHGVRPPGYYSLDRDGNMTYSRTLPADYARPLPDWYLNW